MSVKEANPELMKTGLAGSSVESEENIIDIFTDEPKKEEPAVVTSPLMTPKVNTTSKMDEIQKAFDMKEKGMLSEDEFKALKSEILAK